ncbi:angiopoietin-related protein 6-like [Watersipora subatra]|uniref:angiopoietin-related protein 6-like n=1 Tax=Watersipora subatra TaxID=2589382 RepID=UPI00355C8625
MIGQVGVRQMDMPNDAGLIPEQSNPLRSLGTCFQRMDTALIIVKASTLAVWCAVRDRQESFKCGVSIEDHRCYTGFANPSDQSVIRQNNKGQELFQLRQNIYAARQLLQNECPALFAVNHGIYDDSLFPFHLEIAKIVHSRLLDHLVKCLATQTITAENVTSQPSFNQSRAMEEATSIPQTSQQLLTEQPTTEQSMTSEFAASTATEDTTSAQPTSQQLLTEPPTTEQSVTSEVPTPKDCQKLYDEGNKLSGVYQINPFDMAGEAFPVWCDFIDGYGWTVFQKRFNGSVDFLKNWTDYQTGFGYTDGEYWLGLDKIHALTSTNTKLSILLKAANGTTKSGIWQSFYINDSSDGYRLTSNGSL